MRVQETRNKVNKSKGNSGTFQRHAVQFKDHRNDTIKQLKVQRAANSFIQMQGIGVVQRAVVDPTYTGVNHGQTVKLDLGVGDTVVNGGAPSVDPDGYDELRTIHQSHLKGTPHWVRFHVLNAKAGGKGNNKGNLTPATGSGNHSANWTKYEDDVKDSTGDPADRPMSTKIKVNYKQSKDIFWKKGAATTKTNNNNYPNSISAELNSPKYPGKTYSLDSGDDLGKIPQQYNNDGWKAYSDATHTTQIAPDP